MATFRAAWANFDPNATSFIPISQLRNLLTALGDPLGFTQTELKNKYLQDKFIASLELPTYADFSKYQFLDVLNALSLRLMVIDHTRQFRSSMSRSSKGEGGSLEMSSDEEDESLDSEEQQEEVKKSLQRDINKLVFHQRAEEITAVKEVMHREKNASPLHHSEMRDGGLTSMHHAAAEVAINRMRRFVSLRRQVRYERMISLMNAPSEASPEKLGAPLEPIEDKPDEE